MESRSLTNRTSTSVVLCFVAHKKMLIYLFIACIFVFEHVCRMFCNGCNFNLRMCTLGPATDVLTAAAPIYSFVLAGRQHTLSCWSPHSWTWTFQTPTAVLTATACSQTKRFCCKCCTLHAHGFDVCSLVNKRRDCHRLCPWLCAHDRLFLQHPMSFAPRPTTGALTAVAHIPQSHSAGVVSCLCTPAV